LNFSDIDIKFNKIDLNANDSLNMENHINNNINSIKLFNLIEETITKASSNIENINLNNQTKIAKKKSKLQYNEPLPTNRNGIVIQTPQKNQIYNANIIGNFNSVTNKKNLPIVDEKKLNNTVKKSNKRFNIANKNPITKSTKK